MAQPKHPAVSFVQSKTGKAIIIGAVLLIGGTISFFIIKKQIKKWKERRDTKDKIKDINFELKETMKGQPLSYPSSTYGSMVSRLVQAFNGCGTSDVLPVFNKLKNNADFLKLKSEFGMQTWDGCNWAMDFGDNEGTLDDAIAMELDDDEISDVNKVLRSKGITYSF